MSSLPLVIITVRIDPPEGASDGTMDEALYAVEGKRTPEQIARFIRESILDADALAGFTVTAEYMGE